MQSTTFYSVPYAVGGVARRAPRPAKSDSYVRVAIDQIDRERNKSAFFNGNARNDGSDDHVRLTWDQAAARMMARAYSNELNEGKGTLVDFSV